uniref:Cysteine-rich receptor-like protein kinase n=1 Tax=Tanacetum cinerariifolium TaxID=118510 RepID=A0A699JNH9_TANCI|nr:cysteine-rich receptor-like protein kinase [Tanacetum cinerariifolium]
MQTLFVNDNLKNQGVNLLGLIKKKFGNGFDTSFWEDAWKGDIAFKFLYPRIYKLETCKQINVAPKLVHDNVRLTLRCLPRGGVELEQFNDLINSLVDLQLPNMQDRWFWSLSGSGDFLITSVRQFIDDHLLPENSKLKSTLVDIDKTIDAGNAKSDILNNRMNVMNSLIDLDKLKSLEVAQKAKIILSIEGDENSKYFHGSNSFVIALIPKTQNANMVKDFRPISLIGSLYKIIAKILANRLVVVLGDIVSDVKSTFVADRQILDGPSILNDLIQRCKSKKKQTMIFKVDFEKAFDSIRWDYLDDVLKKFGFGNR